MPRRIAIVHHRRSFFPLELRQAIGEHLEPLWVLPDESDADPGLRRLLGRSGAVVEADGLPLDEIAARVAEHRPEGIVTFVDDTLCLTAALAARLDLPYHTEEEAATIADKGRQRSAFAAAGLPGPRFWTIGEDIDPLALRQFARDIAYPAVFKPAEGSGSRGIVWLHRAADLIAAHRQHGAAVIEEYLCDTADRDTRFASYLSVESIVCGGRVSHAAICGRFPLAHPFRETGNFIPAAVPDGLEPALLELTEAALHALSIRTAVCHTEIKLTSNGPQLIEVNGRLGGRPPLVLQSISDLNLFRMACELALGDEIVVDGPVATRGVGFYWMAQPPEQATAVSAIRGLDTIGAAEAIDAVTLDRTPGTRVDWQEGTGGKVVTIQGRVPDLDALAATIEFIESTLEIDYETENQPAWAGAGV